MIKINKNASSSTRKRSERNGQRNDVPKKLRRTFLCCSPPFSQHFIFVLDNIIATSHPINSPMWLNYGGCICISETNGAMSNQWNVYDENETEINLLLGLFWNLESWLVFFGNILATIFPFRLLLYDLNWTWSRFSWLVGFFKLV